MREYKFRGKRVDNGEWVYGSLLNNLWSKSVEIIDPSEYPEYDSLEDIVYLAVEVDPETVGQYTGDKNRGYKGDILEWVEPIRGEYGDIEDYENCRGVVEWDNERSGFIVRCANGNEWLDNLMNITIVGNRWDNPHLLEVSRG